MVKNFIFGKIYVSGAGLVLATTLLISGCSKPAPDAAQQPAPGTAAKSATPTASPTPSVEVTETDAATAVVRILNTAHRNGGVILRGECAPTGISDPYPLHPPVKLEPMNDAFQEISGKYQNIYWRESQESGVRVVDSGAKAALLKVRVHEFRIVEDREPDAALVALWRTPEVAAFLRRNRVRMPRKMSTTRKVISPPMIIEMKNALVADILDHIAAGYHGDPPKVWIYWECANMAKKEMMIDVQVK
ncbi:MAG TPA: hypothetical protein VHA06_11935 [Candidatus Angelobacter sp.]|jgi:hypothetical protein|nr:hypothetical protein [Candidatus Angelobacter sp.]